MPTLEQLKTWAEEGTDIRSVAADDGRIYEREHVIAYLRQEASSGSADFEHKMNKIIAAIERGEHEQ